MAYATKDEIKSLFRDFADNAEAAVNDDEIDVFIENTDSIIDAKIGTVYALPITELLYPESFKILKQIQMFKVACIIDDILNDYSEADKKPMWCKKAHSLLEALVPSFDPKTCKQCPPSMILPDAPYQGTSSQKNKITVSATSGRQFEKGVDTW